MKMIELLCSGSFRTEPGTDRNNVSFSDVKILIPKVDEEYHTQQAKRMFPVFRLKDKKLKEKSYEGLIKIYIDDYKEIDAVNPAAGKNIKEMSWEELQYFSCTYKLREIPLYQTGGIREAREKAYEVYMKVYKKRKVFKTAQDKLRLKDQLQRKFERMGLEQYEIDERIDEQMKKAFDMTIDPNNKDKSYNFAKLPAIVPIEAADKSK